jgi:hypothetical protein
MNGDAKTLRFSGVVDPRDFRPQNIVASSDVINAKMEVVGRGDVSEAGQRTWLQRCSPTPWPSGNRHAVFLPASPFLTRSSAGCCTCLCKEITMPTPFKTALAIASCVASCLPSLVRAAEAEPALIGASAQVAGQQLQLNGAGISKRLLFKVYTVGLYLRDQRRTTEAVLSSDGPRRLVIRLMRDISAKEFEEAVLDKLAKDIAQMDARVAEQMNGLSQALAHLPSGCAAATC